MDQDSDHSEKTSDANQPVQQLIDAPKLARVSRSLRRPVSVRILETEQTEAQRQKALRLYCRAMIRLYIQKHGSPNDGKRLGVL